MDHVSTQQVFPWPSVSAFLRAAHDLHEWLGSSGRNLLARHGGASVRVPGAWPVDPRFFLIEPFNGELGLSIDPLGTYLRDGNACVWVIAGIWDPEALRRYLAENRTFGTHIYFGWSNEEDEWDFAMHPVSEAPSLLARVSELQDSGNEVELDSFQFMERIPVNTGDLETLESRVATPLAKAAALLGIQAKR